MFNNTLKKLEILAGPGGRGGRGMIANGYGFLYGDDENILKSDTDDRVNTLNYTELYKLK